MLDGSATETFTAPPVVAPRRSDRHSEHRSDNRHSRRPGPSSHSTELPRSLFNPTTVTAPEIPQSFSNMSEPMMKQEMPTMTDPKANEYKPNPSDEAAAQQLMAEIMKQAPPPVPNEIQQPINKTLIDDKDPTVPGEVAGSKNNKSILWNWSPDQINNFVKTLGDKIKHFGRNAWYYMSGSFIWDKQSKPT